MVNGVGATTISSLLGKRVGNFTSSLKIIFLKYGFLANLFAYAPLTVSPLIILMIYTYIFFDRSFTVKNGSKGSRTNNA